jgi:hypothetical protein
MSSYQPPHIKCLGCGWIMMTWAEQRRQFGRAVRAGLSLDETKQLMPRCQKCTTEALHARGLTVPSPMQRLR